MSHALKRSLTAEDLFSAMKRMPAVERMRFFSLLSGSAFRDDDFTHEQVFGHLEQESFSLAQAAQYLEISASTLRRHVQAGRLLPSQMVGRSPMFSVQALRVFKRNLQ